MSGCCLRVGLLFSLLVPAILHLRSQAYYLTGGFIDSLSRPVPFVHIRLKNAPLLFDAGNAGAFGIPSFLAADSAICYVEGFDTARVFLKNGQFQQIMLRYTADRIKKTLYESRLSSLSRGMEGQQEMTATGELSGESYNEIAENPFLDTRSFPMSGFVPGNHQASFSNIRRFINNGNRVPRDAIRTEELWNYVSPVLGQPRMMPDGFSAAIQLGPCPWQPAHRLLMVQWNAPLLPTDHLPPANLVFLIDNSGSMDEPNRLPLLKNGFKQLTAHLRSQDRVAIVTYGGAAGIMLPPTPGNEKTKIITAIEELLPGGATPGSNGIQLAYQLATTNPIANGINKVILATDGDFNIGLVDDASLERLISSYRNSGVTLSCLGVGMGNYKDSKIEILAKMGKGNFAYLDTEEEAEKVMVQELTQNMYTVAEEATIQVAFNPAAVLRYRQVGYQNRKQALGMHTPMLLGAPLGSGQHITALFEIVPAAGADSGVADMGSTWLNFRKNGGDSVFSRITLPLRAMPVTLQQSDPAFVQAASLAWYASLLRQAYTGRETVSFEAAETLARQAFSPDDATGAGVLRLFEKTRHLYEPGPEPRKKGTKNRKE